MNYAEFFSQGLIGRIIPSFPYAERYCRFCERELFLDDAIHIQDEPAHYKALYKCENPRCSAFDEDSKSQYVRVYYSSDEAFRKLETHAIHYNVVNKD